MKKEVGSGVGSGSAPKCHGSPTLLASSDDFIYVQEMCKDDETENGTRLIRKVCAILAANPPTSKYFVQKF